MRLIELTVMVNPFGSSKRMPQKMAINTDFISHFGPSTTDPKTHTYIKLKDGTFLRVVAPYRKLMGALRVNCIKLTK